MCAYFTIHLDLLCQPLYVSMCATTPIGDLLLMDCVYQSCAMTILEYYTRVDFNEILGMD